MTEKPNFTTTLVNIRHEKCQQNQQVQLGDTWESPFMALCKIGFVID
jgi:hypothetical protein